MKFSNHAFLKSLFLMTLWVECYSSNSSSSYDGRTVHSSPLNNTINIGPIDSQKEVSSSKYQFSGRLVVSNFREGIQK